MARSMSAFVCSFADLFNYFAINEIRKIAKTLHYLDK